jgi:hypothetical protein
MMMLREEEKKQRLRKEKGREKKKKEKGGEKKYNCLKSRDEIVIVNFERILFIMLTFFVKMKRLKSEVFNLFC